MTKSTNFFQKIMKLLHDTLDVINVMKKFYW
jgi:hypothetical protein